MDALRGAVAVLPVALFAHPILNEAEREETMIINQAEVISSTRRAPHSHLWGRDDRDGYREYVCVICAASFGIRADLLTTARKIDDADQHTCDSISSPAVNT